jgi:hypothetical protein
MQAVSIRGLIPVILICASAGIARDSAAQDIDAFGPKPIKPPSELQFKHDKFTFARVQYSDIRGPRRLGSWATDYPDSEQNFSARFQKVTGLPTDPNGRIVKLTDPELKTFPFLYLVEGGGLQLEDAEVAALRAYLLGGGFLMIDDFWGEAEWDSLKQQLQRVFPDREAKELDLKHPVFHSFYDITEKPQVPSIHVALSGRTFERADAIDVHYRGISDDNGRLMVIICHNTDLGDGWERADEVPEYYQQFSLPKAYPMGINIVVYALTP